MAYIGYVPAAKPLTSADITDGIVSIADLSATGTPSSSNFLRGDGTWNAPQAGFSGATTTSSAVDITLTSSSTQVQNITMTATGKSVILPNATTLTTKGAPIFVINNQGLNPIAIKNNGGFILNELAANANLYLTLNDNATANGSWSSTSTNFFLGTSEYTNVITGTTGVGSIGSNAQGNFFYGISSSKISSTSAIITYQKGTSQRDVYGVVVSYSGTTITVNSEVLLYNGSSTAATNANVLMLDSTSGFLFVSRASNSVVVPFTISGTSITAGTASSTFGVGTFSDSSTTPLGSAIAMSSTIALLTESNSTTANTFVFRTITHNGSSAPTIGSTSSAVTTLYNYQSPAMSYIDSTNAFVAYASASTTYTVARVVTISGSSAPTLQTANTSSVVNTGNICIKSISSTKFNVAGGTGSEVYTVSGTSTSYTGYTVYLTSMGNNTTAAFVGDYMFSLLYNVAAIYINQITNDYFASKGNKTMGKSYYLRAYSTNSSSYLVGLDSTTAFGITNNAGSSTVSIEIIKIL